MVDQGNDSQALYCDVKKGICTDVPCLVFGDHTRCVKYIDEPFVRGADGVKVLTTLRADDNVRYWYHALRSARVPNLGYSRHFKLIKELCFADHAPDDQCRIASLLDAILRQVEICERKLSLLDQLVKSRFVEVFIETGKPNPVVCLGDYCKHVNNGITRRDNDTEGSIVLRLVELQEGLIDYSSVNRMVLTDREKAKFLLNDGDILFARVNGNPDNVGRCSAFFGISEPVFHNDHIIRATIAPEYFEPIYIAQFVNSPFGREQICKGLKTSAGQYTINQEGIANVQIPLPPLSLQQEFASFVSQVDKSQFVICAGTGIGDCEACPSSRIPRHLQSPQQRPNEHPRPTLWLAKELAMGLLHVVLVDHGETKRRVNLAVPQQNLHLFDGHPLVYGLRCKRPAKLVGMHLLHPGSLPKFAQARLHAAYF